MQNGSSVVSYSEKLRNTLRNNNVLMIGNGFDLALGKLSSYQDFLLYLFLLKLYLHVNGEKFQGPIDNLDALFEKCTNLDPKIKFIVDIVNRKSYQLKKISML